MTTLLEVQGQAVARQRQADAADFTFACQVSSCHLPVLISVYFLQQARYLILWFLRFVGVCVCISLPPLALRRTLATKRIFFCLFVKIFHIKSQYNKKNTHININIHSLKQSIICKYIGLVRTKKTNSNIIN